MWYSVAMETTQVTAAKHGISIEEVEAIRAEYAVGIAAEKAKVAAYLEQKMEKQLAGDTTPYDI